MSLNNEDQKRLTGYADKERTEQEYSDQEIFDALADAEQETNTSPLTRTRYQGYYDERDGVPHSHTIIRRFDKWSTALSRAGLDASTRSPYQSRTSEAALLRALLTARAELGHLPSVAEYQRLWEDKLRAQGHPSAGTIRVFYGKWRLASEAAAQFIGKEDTLEDADA